MFLISFNLAISVTIETYREEVHMSRFDSAEMRIPLNFVATFSLEVIARLLFGV